jgi:hypothetical protein
MTRNYSYQRESRSKVNRATRKKSNARFKQTFESRFLFAQFAAGAADRLRLTRKPLSDNRIETTVQLGRVSGAIKDFSAFSDAHCLLEHALIWRAREHPSMIVQKLGCRNAKLTASCKYQ